LHEQRKVKKEKKEKRKEKRVELMVGKGDMT